MADRVTDARPSIKLAMNQKRALFRREPRTANRLASTRNSAASGSLQKACAYGQAIVVNP
jgi:hypothetical protein